MNEQLNVNEEPRIKELEKQLAEARADADHRKSECNTLQRMEHEAWAEIEHKTKLINLMLKVLKLPRDGLSCADYIEIEQDIEAIDAALAAEGGKKK